VIDTITNCDIEITRACFILDEAIKVTDSRPSLKIVKVHRNGNMAGHKAATLSRFVLSSGILHYYVPTSVMEQVVRDCNLNEFK
jgi:hypothetical protein